MSRRRPSERSDLERAIRRFARIPRAVLLRTSLLVTPRVVAQVYRRAFAADGAAAARALLAQAPAGVDVTRDEPYGPGPNALLDVYRPAGASGALPTLVWVHGGGWFGGTKEERAGWFRIIAARGYAVVSPRYPLSPRHTYPAPPRQIMQAIAHVHDHGDRLGVDPERLAVGGDSAGAQIAAQIGALVTTPGYADAVGVRPALHRTQLRGLVLACGFYDLALAAPGRVDPRLQRLLRAELWAYSGRRRYLRDPAFATMSVVDHLTAAFPPALVTVGNGDALAPQTLRLVEALRAVGAEPETVLYGDDHRPALDHEYQFDFSTTAARNFLERMLAFLAERCR